MFAAVENGNVDRILLPNYFYIHRLKKSEEKMKLFSVVGVVHEPFLTGLAMVNKLSSDNKAFLSCLRKKVKSYDGVCMTCMSEFFIQWELRNQGSSVKLVNL